MHGILEKEVIRFLRLIPLAEHGNLIAHKVEFFSGMHIHVHVQGAQLRESLLVSAKNLVNDRPFPVYYLIMREGKQMTLIVIIIHGECQKFGALGPLVRSLHKIIQRIVHPAKIPLIIKSQAAFFRRLCAAGIGCAVLSDQHGCRMQLMETGIHFFQKLHCCLVYAAQLISHPVDHTADGVHAQTVKMILFKPVVGSRLHKAGYLAAGKNEIAAAPFGVRDITDGIFIQFRSVIPAEGIIVQSKVRRNKVQDRADPGSVQTVDQLLQLLRRSIAGGRTEKARTLISPASVKGMLGERHKLYMRISVGLDIVDQFISDFFIRIPAVGILFIASE